MKIFNFSTIRIDRMLWHRVSKDLGLGGMIKDAELVDRKMLAVVVHSEKQRPGDDRSIYGESTIGRIDVFPCRSCTYGAVTFTFLHELAHIWISQFHEDVDVDAWIETFCEEFARRALSALGGQLLSGECHIIDLENPVSESHEMRRLIEECFESFESRARGSLIEYADRKR